MSYGLAAAYMVLFYGVVHGIGLGAALGNCWIVLAQRTGRVFPGRFSWVWLLSGGRLPRPSGPR